MNSEALRSSLPEGSDGEPRVAHDNQETPPAANEGREQGHDASYETVLSGLEAEITKAPQGAVIIIGALREDERERSLERLAEAKGIVLVSSGADSVPHTIPTERSETTVFNNNEFLKEILFGSREAATANDFDRLLERGENCAPALLQWLQEIRKPAEEDAAEQTPEHIFQRMLERLRTLSDGSRPVLFEVPADSALGLALLTYSKMGKLESATVDDIIGEHVIQGRLATIRLMGTDISTTLGGEQIGSRAMYG